MPLRQLAADPRGAQPVPGHALFRNQTASSVHWRRFRVSSDSWPDAARIADSTLPCRGSLSGERSERPVPARSFPCLAEGPAGAQDERDGGFGDGRFDEPAAANRVALAWNSRRGVMKVRVPDTGLSKPKTIMKVRMDRGFQVRGRPGCPGLAPPGQQSHSAGAGDMRLAGCLLRPQGRDPWRTP